MATEVVPTSPDVSSDMFAWESVAPARNRDADVLSRAVAIEVVQRGVNVDRIAIAGDIAHRSTVSLGVDGMARTAGYARPALLVAALWSITPGKRTDSAKWVWQSDRGSRSTALNFRRGIRRCALRCWI